MTFFKKIKILIESSQAIIHPDLHGLLAGRWLPVRDSAAGPAGHLISCQLLHIFYRFLNTAVVTFLIYRRPLMAVYWSWNLKRGYHLDWELWRGGRGLKLVWLALSWIQGLLYYVKQKVFLSETLNVSPPLTLMATNSFFSSSLFSFIYSTVCGNRLGNN